MHVTNTLNQCTKVIATMWLITNLEYRASKLPNKLCLHELSLISCTKCCDVCVCVSREIGD